MKTRAKNNIRKPIQKLNLHIQLSKPLDLEPTTPTQALKDPKWRKAMSKEYDALVRNGTWELVPSVKRKKIIFALNNFIESGDEDLYKRFPTIMLIYSRYKRQLNKYTINTIYFAIYN